MTGYIYQVRYALFLLLENDDDDAKISVETFDDVAFTKDDNSSNIYIQLKHHTKSYGDLTNSSTDLWKTINVWLNEIRKDNSILDTTKFLIITTAKAPLGSITNYLKSNQNERNTILAYELLQKVAETSKNQQHLSYYDNFKNTSKEITEKLVEKIYIIDESCNIQGTSIKIQKKLKYSCKAENIPRVYERLEGWWLNKIINSLSSENPIYVDARQIISFILDTVQEYALDNLPIDIPSIMDITDSELKKFSHEQIVFCEQLKLIKLKSNSFKIAIRDYYRAYIQRSNWVRENLLYLNELDKYENRLIDEWDYSYSEMLDTIEEDESECTEDMMITYGKKLFKEIGRVLKTKYILDYYTNKSLRKEVQKILNKGESINAVARLLFFGKQGRLNESSLNNQLEKASCLNILLGSLIVWNSRYLEKTYNTFKDKDWFDIEEFKKVSPLGTQHINFLGKYIFEESKIITKDGLRSLKMRVQE